MIEIRQYFLSVICVVVLCGLMQLLLPSGTAGALLKLICGLLVMITVVRPLLQDRFFQWDLALENIHREQELAIWEGENYSRESLRKIIMEKTQAYILNKASELGADITVELELSRDSPYLPKKVTLFGTITPYAKQQMAEFMESELGIAKEDQRWIS